MKLVQIILCSIHFHTIFTSSALNVEEEKTQLRGVRNNNLHRNKNKDSHIQRALSSDDINGFKIEHDLKQENDLHVQMITNNSVNVRGTIYPLDKLTHVNVFAKDATCFDDNIDITQDCVTDSNSFIGKQGGETILITKDTAGNIQTVKILHEDGSETNLATITENIMAKYDEEDIDEDKLSKFSLHGDIVFEDKTNHAGNRKLFPVELHHKFEKENNEDVDCTFFRIIETAIVFDSTFCSAEGGAANARNTIENIIAGASIYYQQQGACMKLELKHLEGFCDPNKDPFKAGIQTGNIGCSRGKVGLLDSFIDWWKSERINVQKDAAHIFYHHPFTGPDSNIAGCAMPWGMWGSLNNGFGAESMDFSHDLGRRTTLFSHELGHNLGLDHTRNSDGNKYIMHSGKPSWGHHIWHPNDLMTFHSYTEMFPLHEEPATDNSSGGTLFPQSNSQSSPQTSPQQSLQSTPYPTPHPTPQPTAEQSPLPSSKPTLLQSLQPTLQPTLLSTPSQRPSRKPTPQATTKPTLHPTRGFDNKPPMNGGRMMKVVGDLCLTILDSVVGEGIEPIMSKCIADKISQGWLIESDGRIHSALDYNICIHARSFMHGSAIDFQNCSSNKRQQWEIQNNGRLKSKVHRHLCLTANDDGQVAYIWPCWLEDDQFWTFV